jgi:hypothetical protein
MSTITQEGLFLSELLGAHDISDFVPKVVGISAAVTGLLERGDVVCMMADGVVLAGSAGSTPADVYGVVLDFTAPTAAEPTIRNCTVARSGVFDATMLTVDASTNLSAFAPQLRAIGIFLEKLVLSPGVLGAEATPPPPPPSTQAPPTKKGISLKQ